MLFFDWCVYVVQSYIGHTKEDDGLDIICRRIK